MIFISIIVGFGEVGMTMAKRMFYYSCLTLPLPPGPIVQEINVKSFKHKASIEAEHDDVQKQCTLKKNATIIISIIKYIKILTNNNTQK